jgi:hypothetical protein
MPYQNFFATRLKTDIGSSDTIIDLETAPTATAGRIVLEARNPTQREVIKYTGVAGTTITGVTRGQGGTTAKPHTKNALAEMNMTAEDLQDLYDAFASFVATNNDWRLLPYTVGTVTPLGNGSYSVPITGVDITPTVSEGMRVRLTRTVAAPNTSFSLDGTNDYYVKASPNKMLWTDDFAAGFWIYPTAYPTSFAGIASRYNGTSGWEFLIDSKGCVILIGHNAGSGNFRGVTSYQSVPLNKWTFIAAQLDMSAHTVTPTTSYVMMNGVDVPAYVSQAGTNPTALIQAGNFEIGSTNSGTNLFSGYIGDGGVFSAKITQATMLGYMNQPLTGSETNLASGYKNGSVTDLNTTTPNNLVATNGATTVANAPYGNRGVSTTFEYGVIMKESFSTDTTLIIQAPEGCAIPTSGGISAISYSTVDTPVGFPRDKGRWCVESNILGDINMSSPVSGTKYNLGATQLRVPLGSWKLGLEGVVYAAIGTGNITIQAGLSKTNNTFTEPDLYCDAEANAVALGAIVNRSRPVVVATATPYYLVTSVQGTSPAAIYIFGGRGGMILTAENAYI